MHISYKYGINNLSYKCLPSQAEPIRPKRYCQRLGKSYLSNRKYFASVMSFLQTPNLIWVTYYWDHFSGFYVNLESESTCKWHFNKNLNSHSARPSAPPLAKPLTPSSQNLMQLIEASSTQIINLKVVTRDKKSSLFRDFLILWPILHFFVLVKML